MHPAALRARSARHSAKDEAGEAKEDEHAAPGMSVDVIMDKLRPGELERLEAACAAQREKMKGAEEACFICSGHHGERCPLVPHGF